jgi:hypothetical protein
MRSHPRRAASLAAALAALAAPALAAAQPAPARDTALVARRDSIERELQAAAVVERKVMVAMRDGVRMAADVYYPRAPGRYPVVFSRTPYNFNHWDVRLGAPRDLSTELAAVKRGYAYVTMNERGHFFSEGNYDILGAPVTDGEDAIRWLATRPWSNGRVGLIGCSSTAEWQMAVAARRPEGLAAIIPQGFGAGVGRVGPYVEQGNWYRGGAIQMLFIAWLYGEQNQVRPMFPPGTPRADLERAARLFDLAPQMPPVDWARALRTLPVQNILAAVGGPRGIFADSMPVATGGAMVRRTPGDPAWRRGGLWDETMRIDVPGLWFMSWYDVSVGPNLAAYNRVRQTASPAVAAQQYAVIAPTLHCAYKRATENTVVGERSVGDARLDYDALTFGWFDHFLKGERNRLLDTLPKVRYYTMGSNRWQSSPTWPPAGARAVTYYLASGGRANTAAGDGRLTLERPPAAAPPDTFTYDPANPVPSLGGNVCCTGNAVRGGAFDQRPTEARPDVLVYSTEPLKEGVEVSGPVTVTLHLASDRTDTDVTAKLVDVDPEGRAYNLDETIQRVRYREGYDRETRMQPGRVYEVTLSPMTTSNYFAPGHRIRLEVSSSNFPRFDRNLNTGGRNYDEASGLVARNAIHHTRARPSRVVLTVAPAAARSAARQAVR